MTAGNSQERASTRPERLVHTMKVVRVVVLVAALAALAILLVKMGIDPASAGKKTGF